jgi:hypothetical protein
MARSDAYKTQTESPVKKYLSWSSNEKCFTYWDKDSKTNKSLPLPLNFIHYDEMATIKGWHDASGSGIYSNEIKSTKNQELHVRSFKGGEIVSGFYSDIKGKINSAGGDYHISLYAELDGEIVNLSFKGAALMTWSDFAKENRKSFEGSYIKVAGALDAKKGSVKYSIPVFEIGDTISSSVSSESDKKYDLLQEYFKSRKANAASVKEEATVSAPESILTPAQESSIPAFDEPSDTSELPF